uniref:Uncharacterized protein n=1 Tax=Chromera velia CCMP2878 TaxID=1169474 RepID=A0A0G4HEZ1_9ALVE|eukprot:Cvel_6541.t1-p1 / transcript=Cvel_6541.t1 / gene=Cvel_6541 / organism=Chromera_velia_CCMP2878 / gene_product=hypothetical protein / transcript_product=hypothetical protein / location=Cvel_scaffold322:24020-24442(+) / protein_length=141 / sequence_SO=supercontig / SO=protein_coding / is_pseudo=false
MFFSYNHLVQVRRHALRQSTRTDMDVRFQFALVGPGLDSVQSGASVSGGVTLIAGGSLVEGGQNSSAVTSSALPSAAPTDAHRCCGDGHDARGVVEENSGPHWHRWRNLKLSRSPQGPLFRHLLGPAEFSANTTLNLLEKM